MSLNKDPYRHKAQYYETDQMGIIHHSNYIRWFEEARTDMLDKAGLGYDEMERMGIIVPVLSVSCEYKSMVRYNDTVLIIPQIYSFNGIKLVITYEIIDEPTKELRARGKSEHCFLSKDHKLISIKRLNHDVYALLDNMAVNDSKDKN